MEKTKDKKNFKPFYISLIIILLGIILFVSFEIKYIFNSIEDNKINLVYEPEKDLPSGD